MRKKFFPALITVMAATGALSVKMAFATPPVYRSNLKDDLMITKINPKQNYFVIEFNANERVGEWPTYVNFQTGGLTDYQLHYLYNGEVTTALYKGLSFLLKSGGIQDGDTYKITRSDMPYGANLMNNTSGMIDYYIEYGVTQPQRSRVDYRRCVNSSVFNYDTMECVMEDLGNGYIAYQPYTLDGERVEIPAAEDARLSQITEEWRAEPGNWGAEWYAEPEPEVVELEPEAVEPEPDPEGLEVAPVVEPEAELIAEPEVAPEVELEVGPIVESEVASVAAGAEIATAVTGVVTEVDTTPTNTDTTPANVESFSYIEENIGENTESFSSMKENLNAETEVGIPNLGKEAENQPNWAAIILISLASVAGLVGWFFLFFGKYQLKRRKEKKE